MKERGGVVRKETIALEKRLEGDGLISVGRRFQVGEQQVVAPVWSTGEREQGAIAAGAG